MSQRPSSDPPYPQIADISHHHPDGVDRLRIEALLDYLRTLHDGTGQPINEEALEMIAALLARVEAAERAVLIYQAEAIRAGRRATAAERRALIAEDSLSASQQAIASLRSTRASSVPTATIYEFPGREKVCRVCGRPAPPPTAKRRDDLRVCALESCRKEARRRDNAAKQLRYAARKRTQRACVDLANR